MYLNKHKRYYHLAFVLIAMGYVWLLVNCSMPSETYRWHACFFKYITGTPCPSCGSTRAAVYLLHGDMTSAMATNPLGMVILTIMVLFPIGYVYDLAKKQDRFYHLLVKMERKVKHPRNAIIFTILLLANWAWNIYKQL